VELPIGDPDDHDRLAVVNPVGVPVMFIGVAGATHGIIHVMVKSNPLYDDDKSDTNCTVKGIFGPDEIIVPGNVPVPVPDHNNVPVVPDPSYIYIESQPDSVVYVPLNCNA